LASYSVPITAAHLLYQSIPLAARSIVASVYGFAETGQFSLAYDIGIRAVQALGSALDALLFQIAVATHEEHGADRAKEQIARNMSVVIAFLLPACVGIWMVLPSIEQLIVPGQFRGPFGHYLKLLLPGLFAMALILFGINPVFQIEKKTAPLIGAALAAIVCGLVFVLVLPWGTDASNLALAQCGAYLAALGATIFFAARTRPIWPCLRDLAASVAATLGMAAALWPLRDMASGFCTLLLQVALGAGIYGVLTLLLDIAGLRAVAIAWLRPLLARARGARRMW
jgi:O-antigen/teichoic acid export membrane protein